MKEGIHPKNYRKVVFKDMSNDGNEYPLFKLDISYKSHPFFTGQSMFIDTAGRIDKFKKRYQKKAD
jgi:large subunit ribosomal protein L31